MNIDVLLPSMPLVLLKAHMCRSDDTLTSCACLACTRRRYSEPFQCCSGCFYRKMHEGRRRGMCPVSRCGIQSRRDELGCGMGHYAITLWWSQRGIKLFQTNITPVHPPVAAPLRVRVCPASEKWWRNKACVGVKGVSGQSLWFGSVTVSRGCGSVSAALLLPLPLSFSLSPLSLHPLLGPPQHLLLAAGQGKAGVSKQLKARLAL